MTGNDDASRFIGMVEGLVARAPHLTPLAAAILCAAQLGIAADSRSFARRLDVAHALVLRELNMLCGPAGLLRIVRSDKRTMRASYVLEDRARVLLDCSSLAAAA